MVLQNEVGPWAQVSGLGVDTVRCPAPRDQGKGLVPNYPQSGSPVHEDCVEARSSTLVSISGRVHHWAGSTRCWGLAGDRDRAGP